MTIDKSRCYRQTVGIDGTRGGIAQFTCGHNPAVADRNVPAKGGDSRAVNHPAILDQQIISHRLSPPKLPVRKPHLMIRGQ
jgi:hypothetical protein